MHHTFLKTGAPPPPTPSPRDAINDRSLIETKTSFSLNKPYEVVSCSCMTPWNVLRHPCHVVPLGTEVWPHLVVSVVSRCSKCSKWTVTTNTTPTTLTTATTATTLTTLTTTWGHTSVPGDTTWHWCLRTFHGVIHQLLTQEGHFLSAGR